MRSTFWLAGLAILLAGGNVLQWRMASKPASEDEVVRGFFELWTRKNLVFRNRWLGVRSLQNPLDVWITQEIIHEVKPDFIVEAGTFEGGSAPLWAMILEQVNPDGRVITLLRMPELRW